jgi:hypothetical protein
VGISFQHGIFAKRNTSIVEALYRTGKTCQGRRGCLFIAEREEIIKRKTKTKNVKRNQAPFNGLQGISKVTATFNVTVTWLALEKNFNFPED